MHQHGQVFLSWPTEQDWIAASNWSARAAGAPAEVAAVLLITGSLTRQLEYRYRMRLQLKIKDQFVDRCEPEEARLLECALSAPCLRRRVSLLHRGEVMFDAESVLPLDSLPVETMEALQEGRQPLGNILIDRGLTLSRSDLSLATLRCPDAGDDAPRWARSSVLRSESGGRALVTECFRPAMWSHLSALGRRQ